MALLALELPPGVYRNGTRYEAKGRYYDADLWRWFEGSARPVGGWRQKGAQSADGAVRAVLPWRTNDSSTWIGLGSNEGLFVMDRSGNLYDVTPAGWTDGPADAIAGGGYGTGLYGTGVYGAPRPDETNIIPAMVWTLDTWGQNLIGCDGRDIYEWALVSATPAAAVLNAPEAGAILVTEERSVFAIAAGGDPRAVDWSDAEDNTDWTPTSTNLAGGKRLQTNGRLMCGKRVRGGYLILSDADVHLAEFVGLPLVYSFSRLAADCGLIAKGAIAAVDSRAWWMGAGGFWSYNGSVTPMPCEVGDYVFGDMNVQQASKISATHVSQFGEVWWFYPSASSTENDRYVVYNYRENHWSIGAIERLCGADRGVLQYPLMVDASGAVFEHEVGQQRDGREPFVLTGPIELGEGDRTMDVLGIIPDESNLGDVTTTVTLGDYPMSADTEVGPFGATDKTDCRFNARRVSIKHVATADQDFRLGRFRYDAQPGSER